MTKEEAIAQFNSPQADKMREVASRHAVPFVWGVPGGELHNGSAFFWKSDNTILAVTASHCYLGYLKMKDSTADVVCQLGTDVIFTDISERLIDCGWNPSDSQEPDIATFHVTEEEVKRAGKYMFSMPACTPEVGMGVVFAGFPATARESHGLATYTLHIMTGLVVASSVNERDITCHFERECMVAAPDAPSDLHGVSGAFLAAAVNNEGRIFLQPVGVVYEYHSPLEILKAHRLDTNLLPDGHIRHSLTLRSKNLTSVVKVIWLRENRLREKTTPKHQQGSLQKREI